MNCEMDPIDIHGILKLVYNELRIHVIHSFPLGVFEGRSIYPVNARWLDYYWR